MQKKTLSIATVFSELCWGMRYLLFEVVFLPTIVLSLNNFLPHPFSVSQLNFIIYCLNFAAVAVIFRRFLHHSVSAAAEDPVRLFKWVLVGFVSYWMGNILVSRLILQFDPSYGNINDSAISGMLQEDFILMAIATVVLVPVTEECLFRGLFFQGLHRQNRMLAYAISTLAFCAIHILPYIGYYPPLTLLLCLIQYIPAGLCLAMAYEGADTIAAPIIIHAAINAIGVLVMR